MGGTHKNANGYRVKLSGYFLLIEFVQSNRDKLLLVLNKDEEKGEYQFCNII